MLITIPGYLLDTTHNQIAMTVYVHTLWHIATLYIIHMLVTATKSSYLCKVLQWYSCLDKHLSGEIMGSIITTELCDNCYDINN